MNARTRAHYETRARILKALAHPTRLYMVHALSEQERCVADLTARVGADISTVSKHLALLRAAGIVSDHRRGAQVYYRLRVPCILNFFTCVEAVVKSRARELARQVERGV